MLVKAHATDFVQEFGFLLDGKVRFMDGTTIKASKQLCLSPVQRVIIRWMERDARVSCAIADTVAAKAQGLQDYRYLESDEGMYFPYPDYMDVTFHQGSVPFGLDLIFLRSSQPDPGSRAESYVVQIEANTKVGSTDKWTCKACDGVIEVNANYCEAHGICAGDQILMSAVSDTDLQELAEQKRADAMFGYAELSCAKM